MKKIIGIMVAGVALLTTSKIALAVDIDGLNFPAPSTFTVGQIYENIPTNIGETLSGYGKVDSINSIAVGSLCADCELTFQFGDYTVSSVSPTEIRLSGGFFKFYLGFGADNDFSTLNAGGSAGDLVEATNGTLFLTLKGHAVDAAGNTFIGTGVGIGTLTPTGFGTGLLDVDTSAGGVANSFFDSNSIVALFGGPADFELGASFSALHPPYPGECPGGPACVAGSVDTTGTFVPEPGICTLMLAGLSLLGIVTRRVSHRL